MTTILKVQIPVNSQIKDLALAYNKDGSFRRIINDKALIKKLMGDKMISYCKCEVTGDTIDKIICNVSEAEAGF